MTYQIANEVHDIKFDDIKSGKYTPISLRPAASDAFFFFQVFQLQYYYF